MAQGGNPIQASANSATMKQNQRSKWISSEGGTIPSFRRGHLSATSDVKRYQSLSAPHVDGFDFFLDRGLPRAISDIEPAELDLVDPDQSALNASVRSNGARIKFWFEEVKINPPTKAGLASNLDGGSHRRFQSSSQVPAFSPITPRECRELGLMYSGAMTGDFCYQLIQRNPEGVESLGRVVRIKKKFGDMPIMVMSKACHLRGKKPAELIQMKEEVRVWQWRIVNSPSWIYFCVRPNSHQLLSLTCLTYFKSAISVPSAK